MWFNEFSTQIIKQQSESSQAKLNIKNREYIWFSVSSVCPWLHSLSTTGYTTTLLLPFSFSFLIMLNPQNHEEREEKCAYNVNLWTHSRMWVLTLTFYSHSAAECRQVVIIQVEFHVSSHVVRGKSRAVLGTFSWNAIILEKKCCHHYSLENALIAWANFHFAPSRTHKVYSSYKFGSAMTS